MTHRKPRPKTKRAPKCLGCEQPRWMTCDWGFCGRCHVKPHTIDICNAELKARRKAREKKSSIGQLTSRSRDA